MAKRDFDFEALPLLRLATFATAAQVDSDSAAACVTGAAARVGGQGRHSSSGSAGCYHRRVDRVVLLFPLARVVAIVLFLISFPDVSKAAPEFGGSGLKVSSLVTPNEKFAQAASEFGGSGLKVWSSVRPNEKFATKKKPSLGSPVRSIKKVANEKKMSLVVVVNVDDAEGTGKRKIIDQNGQAFVRCSGRSEKVLECIRTAPQKYQRTAQQKYLISGDKDVLYYVRETFGDDYDTGGWKVILNCSQETTEEQCKKNTVDKDYVDFENTSGLRDYLSRLPPKEEMIGIELIGIKTKPAKRFPSLCSMWRVKATHRAIINLKYVNTTVIRTYTCVGSCSMRLSINTKTGEMSIPQMDTSWHNLMGPISPTHMVEDVTFFPSEGTTVTCLDTKQEFVTSRRETYAFNPKSLVVQHLP